ncbi:hypothetical protein MH050_03405 [Bacillus licheniformis]|uniref:hypothetical protein n=1 Tax=Bacillus TaxID=1386 RepID=UPI001312F032|nr:MULTISPECIES: hypothetical protein [Bacillus subtilis group]MCA1181412.1 hypothetical protein [Bacillus licheniformis]MCM3210460.1 hypothetical protein [Bacillus licheniformis]MCM3286066.1 hypothetical protein [Bacillus licheniformis]MCY7739894.1 hypothetical protein [Bacillus licheniformis]MEC2101949.1 hypothetical protein [Bacillus licheniformis]
MNEQIFIDYSRRITKEEEKQIDQEIDECLKQRKKRVQRERRELIEKARSFHVPEYDLDFENMTNEQIQNHIKFIEKTFEMAFSKNENKLFEECQRYISRSSGDDGGNEGWN